jgi:hypothetical protein
LSEPPDSKRFTQDFQRTDRLDTLALGVRENASSHVQ